MTEDDGNLKKEGKIYLKRRERERECRDDGGRRKPEERDLSYRQD
jgi:hypothetical protein